MEREVLKNKYSNGLITVKTKKFNFKKVENVKTIIDQNHSEMMPEEAKKEIFEMRAERARVEIDEALKDEWTLEKINAEIAAARSEIKVRRSEGVLKS